MIGRYGPVIKCEKDGETTFKNVKKDLDIEKLKNGEYKLKDVLDTTKKSGNKKCLGEFKGNEVYLMNGKYGAYINCNGKNSSISHIKKDKDAIILKDVLDVLNGKKTQNSSVLKVITSDISVRKGKYGPYVFYKTNKMKKPKFIPMKGIKIEEVTEQWVNNKL